jgi:hypothetical protein
MSCSCSSFGSYIGNLNCPSVPIPGLGLPCPSTSTGFTDASTVIYSGPQLNCSTILTGETLDNILAQIDSQVCAISGDFSTYNTGCLAPTPTIQSFVEGISAYVCATQASLTLFTGTTFPTYQSSVTASLADISNPGLSPCPSSGILVGDSLNTILTKLASSICDIYTNQISLSGVNWSQCFVVGTAPVTVAQGFSTVISQICQLNTYIQTSGIGGTLPTFNTTGSCLPSGVANDTLVSTVNKLIIRTCAAPTFDINALTWGCTTKPSTVTTDLQDAFQTVLTSINGLTQNFPAVYSGDFVVTNVNNAIPCLGKNIALAVPSTQDRFVAATPLDLVPGTLQDKLIAGAQITLDYTTTPGGVIINANTSGGGNGKVLADVTDATSDYLVNKLEGGVPVLGMTITPALDTTSASHVVQLNLDIDTNALIVGILNAIAADPTLQAILCNAVNSCPSPCAAPSNVTVTYSSSVMSTTTTTTTT